MTRGSRSTRSPSSPVSVQARCIAISRRERDLILAVYRQEVQSLVEAVHDILDEYPQLEALRVWFVRLADFVRVKHGLGEALQTSPL
jgi:hypothetical protein